MSLCHCTPLSLYPCVSVPPCHCPKRVPLQGGRVVGPEKVARYSDKESTAQGQSDRTGMWHSREKVIHQGGELE